MNPGYYLGTFVRAVTTESGKKRTPTLALTFSVTDVAANLEWVSCPPVERTVFVYLSDAAWPYSAEKLERIGFNGDFDNPSIQSEPVQLECAHENYDGKLREKWDLAGRGEFTAEPALPQVNRKLNAMWRNAHKGNAPPPPKGKPYAPPAPASAPASAPPDPTEGDAVPF